MNRKYLHELDVIRVVAAILVMLNHYVAFSYLTPDLGARGTNAQAYPDMPSWTMCGWIGVQLFFVLSGYVIARSAQGRSAVSFAFHRLVRIAPALWILATVA